MRIRSTHPMWKVVFTLISILLVILIVMLTVFTTHRPRTLWRLMASIYMPPPAASTIAGGFTTLPPGSVLPSEQVCTARVHRFNWEPRSDNTAANNSVPTTQQIAQLSPWGPAIGVDPKADTLRQQITGKFTGTTNEILQWVACKWGIDENIVRAEAVAESGWHQSFHGDYTNNLADCPPEAWDGSGCYQSYGILQLKYSVFPSAWPMSRDDTAFNAEYVYAVIRTCYEGWTTYLSDLTPVAGYPRYHAGDIWGCLGRWFSGGWYNQDAINYINIVKSHLTNQEWLQAGF